MNKQTGFAWLPLLIIIATVVVTGSVGYVVFTENTNSNTNTNSIVNITNIKVACAEDAKVCPDGTIVARVAPDCGFAECPASVKANTNANTAVDTSTDNIFSFDDAQVGDMVAGMEIVSVGPYLPEIDFPVVNRKVEFTGQTTVTGNLTNEFSEFSGNYNVCMSDFTDETLINIPTMDDEDRNIGFCFSNPETATVVYSQEYNGTATVTINSYTINSYPSEVLNTALFVDSN